MLPPSPPQSMRRRRTFASSSSSCSSNQALSFLRVAAVIAFTGIRQFNGQNNHASSHSNFGSYFAGATAAEAATSTSVLSSVKDVLTRGPGSSSQIGGINHYVENSNDDDTMDDDDDDFIASNVNVDDDVIVTTTTTAERAERLDPLSHTQPPLSGLHDPFHNDIIPQNPKFPPKSNEIESFPNTGVVMTSAVTAELLRQLKQYDDDGSGANELCSEYLISFLEGTTDAKDNCDGIMNAYIAADCANIHNPWTANDAEDDDHDDYFGQFYEHACCQSLKTHYYEYCDEDNYYLSNRNLLVIVAVMLLCECAKSIIKKNELYFLPEAAGCILVGTLCGFIAHIVLGVNIDDLSFDDELFLGVLLPPIIFEAALSVNKREFRRRRLAILMFAIVGTLVSTFMTGIMVHFASSVATTSPTIPMLDSIIFGALISSIDPVAILSVLTSLHMSETDTIFIIVFGESLLNDGIAITLFKTLVECYSGGKNMTADEVLGATADFLIVGFGSVAIGIACGALCLVYFWIMGRILHPSMEVGSFFLWALVPYYICDGIEWSGIVSIVTMGFFMDLYITPAKHKPHISVSHLTQSQRALQGAPMGESLQSMYVHFDDQSHGSQQAPSPKRLKHIMLRKKRVRLSKQADRHVRFVAHLLAQLSENAIFAYLGLFLLSSNYDWDIMLVLISIVSCILSRVLMVIIVCKAIWHIHILRQQFCWAGGVKTSSASFDAECGYENVQISKTAATLQDYRTRLVLVLAGLRGAVSLALVENVPIYNGVTTEGSEYKPQMKAMTSAAIIFTMFVFGGGAYYILRNLGITSTTNRGGAGVVSSQAHVPNEAHITPSTDHADHVSEVSEGSENGMSIMTPETASTTKVPLHEFS